jgi:SNF2 family DNA or RNA helicase
MLVHLPSKRLVLNLRNPDMVCHVIPTARQFDYKGSRLVAVPHKLDEVRVLRNLGIRAPSPVLHHYSWPGRYSPFYAQRETAQFLTLNPKAFVLNDMGTGKTLATLWAFDFLKSIGVAVKLLVMSPLSTLERTWGDEIFQNFPHLNFCIVHGEKALRQRLLADDSYDVYIINHHGIRVVEKEIIAADFDTVVVDEGAIFRNASTELWKSLNRISAGRARIWWLTGTPTPNGPVDAWAQCRIVAPERVPRYMGKFRDTVMRQYGPFKWVPREGATDTVFQAMQPAVRFTRDQCMDLPPAMYQTREVDLTPEQKKAYKEMLSKLHTEFQGDEVQAVNEAVKVSKLVQIACGVVYDGGGNEVVLPTKPRIDAVLEIVEQAATKVIVFVPFKSVLRYVAEELRRELLPKSKADAVDAMIHGSDLVAEISGDVPARQRGDIFREFQQGKTRVLVAQPAAMSHGLTLTAASTVVWYAPTNSNETYEQANARITRPGQKHTQFIVHIEGSAVERKTYERLKNKQKMQGILLETVKEAYE